MPASQGGTGLTSIATLTNSGISISANGTLSGAGGGQVTAGGLGANTDSTSTILAGNLTGSVNGTAVGTVVSGAAAGATANQDSTTSIQDGALPRAFGQSASLTAGLLNLGASSGARIVLNAADERIEIYDS